MATSSAPSTSDLRRLAELDPEAGRVLSVFVNLDPSEFGTPPARASQIASLLNDATAAVEATEPGIREGLRGALAQVEAFLRGPHLAEGGARGLAVFAAGADEVFEVVRLPQPVAGKVIVERRAHVEPLMVAGSTETWCVVLCNRRVARIFAGTGAEGLEERDRIEDEVHSQHRQGGWSHSNYQRSIHKEVYDHLEHTAEVLFETFQRQGFDHLLVATPPELVSEFESHLHPYLQQRLTGHLSIDVEHSTEADVRAETTKAIEAHTVEIEHAALERLREGLGRGERAAGGREAVEAALEQAAVGCLLIAAGTEDTEDLIERTLAQGGEVLVLRHHPDLGPHGGIAALLRF